MTANVSANDVADVDKVWTEARAKWLESRKWLCLICRKYTTTVPAMLGHLRIKHRRRGRDIGSGYLYGSVGLKSLAAFVGSDTREAWQENVRREWDNAHKKSQTTRK